MIQYLQSWFPGWGGWYGYSQTTQQLQQGITVEDLTPEEQQQWSPEESLGMIRLAFTLPSLSGHLGC